MAKTSERKLTPIRKAEAPAFEQIGATGLKRTGQRGFIYEEFLRELSGGKAIKVFREMTDNDPTVGAVLFAIRMVIRNVKFYCDEGDEMAREYVESCIHDMAGGFDAFLSDALSMLSYGYSWHEIIYKKRGGPNDQPVLSSKYNDGNIGWAKWPIRSQDSWLEWIWDEQGELQAFVQNPPPFYRIATIPLSKSLLFRVETHKDSPEGLSLLRKAYRPWYFKKKIEVIEGIGVERDLAGMPVIYRSESIAKEFDDELESILRNIRRDEQEYVLLPLAYDSEGREQLKFELLSAAGSRQLNVGAIIERYDRTIATCMLGDFLLLGHDGSGNRSLGDTKERLWNLALGAILKAIEEPINEVAIPRLLRLNGMPTDDCPKLCHGDIAAPDLEQIGKWIDVLAKSGAALFPDDRLENHLRSLAKLPEKSEEAMAQQQEEELPEPDEEEEPEMSEDPEMMPPNGE